MEQEIKITTEEKDHLGTSLGSGTFRKKYASDKVKIGVTKWKRLSEFLKSKPQAAHVAFIHGKLHEYI